MHWTEILAIIENLLGVAQKVVPLIEKSHPDGSGSTDQLQRGLEVASAAATALKQDAAPAATTTAQ